MNRKLLVMVLAAILSGSTLGAQTFNSGSNGSDGALDLTGRSGTLVFDPASFNPPLDPDHDNVYHFTTVKIPSGLTVRLSADILGVKPVIWLATGAVQIDGTLDLSGKLGHALNEALLPSVAGAGGYGGGVGATTTSPAQPGQGPGGARGAGGGGGHVISGEGGPAIGGLAYGNDFLLPLVGGSGGAGGPIGGSSRGTGGGAGGGAILIASSVAINVNGGINVSGGQGGCGGGGTNSGGGGSGGAIRLVAPVFATTSGPGGIIRADPGPGCVAGAFNGSYGRIRLEAFQRSYFGTLSPAPSVGSPGSLFPPASAPAVRIVSIAGVTVPANPTASFVAPDVTLDNTTTATIQLAGSKVPVGTIVHLTLTPETGAIVNVDSTPLAGTFDSSTATASVTIPHGFSRFSVQASWTP
jgi:hypothetical protein